MRISDWSSDVCSSDLILLVQIPGGQFHNKRCDLGVVRVEFPTVKVEEGFCHYQCRPLVPIHKRMVARNSESVACGKRGRIGIVIRRQVAWSRERRLQQADVANARTTTMIGQLLFVVDKSEEHTCELQSLM